MKYARTLITGLLAAALVLGGGAAHASTATNEDTDQETDSQQGDWRYDPSVPGPGEQSYLAPEGAGDFTTFAFSPAGCVGRTDQAHPSGSDASVHGVTECNSIVSRAGTTTSLQKLGWLYWETMLSQTSTKNNNTWSGEATPHWQCTGWGSQAYRGISYHWSLEGNTTYSSETSGLERRFSC